MPLILRFGVQIELALKPKKNSPLFTQLQQQPEGNRWATLRHSVEVKLKQCFNEKLSIDMPITSDQGPPHAFSGW